MQDPKWHSSRLLLLLEKPFLNLQYRVYQKSRPTQNSHIAYCINLTTLIASN